MRALTLDKLSRPSVVRDPGPEPSQGWSPVEKLVIDPEYQREIRSDGRRAIERIAGAFEWSKFSPVICSPVSLGRFAIIDGQHRTTAAMLCGHVQVPCHILALDRAGQAAAFAAINGNVTKMTTWAIYKAALAAGEGWAQLAKQVAAVAGCKLMTSNKSSGDKEGGEIYGITTMRDMIARHGAAPVTLALSAFKKSVYGDLPIAWGNTILFAWVQAVAGNKRACGMSAAALAAFHNDFDVLEADDVVLADIRAAKRAGEKTLAHMASLAEAIGAALADFTANLKETA